MGAVVLLNVGTEKVRSLTKIFEGLQKGDFVGAIIYSYIIGYESNSGKSNLIV